MNPTTQGRSSPSAWQISTALPPLHLVFLVKRAAIPSKTKTRCCPSDDGAHCHPAPQRSTQQAEQQRHLNSFQIPERIRHTNPHPTRRIFIFLLVVAAAVMGNSIYRFLCGVCSDLSDAAFTPHGAHDSVAKLGQDILNFQRTKQVPEGLGRHVVSSQNAQANWYKKLQVAWKKARPTPTTPEDAAQLVVLTLKNHQKADVEGFLAFYGLPNPNGAAPSAPPSHAPTPTPAAHPTAPTHKPVKAELHTLPVDAKAVADGDTVTVYVDVSDSSESGSVPADIKKAAAERTKARAKRDYPTADALQKTIADAGYRQVPNAKGQEVLARKYRIRLSGIDAPESAMPYGKEAKEALLKLVEGKCLTVHIYDTDRYGRSVGDLHAGGVFVQEQMLKKGFAWHYAAYDKRAELAKWQSQAQAARRGLWASKKPQEPWEYRKAKRNGGA
ncbi:probable staphylococcal-like nuclease CAN1 [Lolium perenne]|uniref:probable staphylococcal-like nuclease CAN1 n=1 Tax=Lolium perenne TaxID=4522 RepID=UPI0021F60775|nr:probable staphylococcal-like nuclease CAN1 [Lolium perenne]